MRKITKKVVGAFMRGERAISGNTSTDGYSLYLHGNRIAEKFNGRLYINSCGWDTVTTRERLNGIDGVSVRTKAGQLYLNGEKWDGGLIEVITK